MHGRLLVPEKRDDCHFWRGAQQMSKRIRMSCFRLPQVLPMPTARCIKGSRRRHLITRSITVLAWHWMAGNGHGVRRLGGIKHLILPRQKGDCRERREVGAGLPLKAGHVPARGGTALSLHCRRAPLPSKESCCGSLVISKVGRTAVLLGSSQVGTPGAALWKIVHVVGDVRHSLAELAGALALERIEVRSVECLFSIALEVGRVGDARSFHER
mmetsp:Transcript_30652/g.67132  ORF Transcript_30652/g.67132 Transcript_30652/m.67132 type:complete len:214 (+) Transcript_30652:172-813(+)